MLKRDLVEDEMKKLARVLARIFGLKEEGKAEDVLIAIEEEIKNNFGKPFPELILIPDDKFVEQLTNNAQLNCERINSLSELLYLYAETKMKLDRDDKAKSIFRKVFLLWEFLEQHAATTSFDRMIKKEKVRELLK